VQKVAQGKPKVKSALIPSSIVKVNSHIFFHSRSRNDHKSINYLIVEPKSLKYINNFVCSMRRILSTYRFCNNKSAPIMPYLLISLKLSRFELTLCLAAGRSKILGILCRVLTIISFNKRWDKLTQSRTEVYFQWDIHKYWVVKLLLRFKINLLMWRIIYIKTNKNQNVEKYIDYHFYTG